jgi:hypothetical protein
MEFSDCLDPEDFLTDRDEPRRASYEGDFHLSPLGQQNIGESAEATPNGPARSMEGRSASPPCAAPHPSDLIDCPPPLAVHSGGRIDHCLSSTASVDDEGVGSARGRPFRGLRLLLAWTAAAAVITLLLWLLK